MPASSYILKTEGKVVTIQKDADEERMVAIDCQALRQNKYTVRICEGRRDTRRLIALHFPDKGCWIKVVDNKLKVEKTASGESPDPIPDNYWFVKQNIGNGKKYILQPFVAPMVWLSLLSDPPYKFILTDSEQNSAAVSAEKI